MNILLFTLVDDLNCININMIPAGEYEDKQKSRITIFFNCLLFADFLWDSS